MRAHKISLLRIRLLASIFTLFLTLLLAACGGNGDGLRAAWVNGIVECPSSPEFGAQVASSANLWDDMNMLRSLTEIPHGAQVQLLGEARSGFHEVRYGTQRGFVQTILLSDYDPAGGVQPNESEC